ncbi:hypothetical protein AN478_09880 [Thiohalorhabdus denitrificans]|uniref:Lipoprotein n=1 Tax=Thiohalorhabdus denitrificans TaxID=381306 RepID=A0A0P9ELL9_9GAMM|nr:hypothetical protein [Thiohalorhabdus denitrificans]KPV39468.1 hypothetical protein AN478_09880 [Thiohalorhabdus denitrificans]SCY01808.1 hypothetical protein SAMN05661077_1061 [Thiohalorhabdus denitrificans]
MRAGSVILGLLAITTLTSGCKLENGWGVAFSQSSGEEEDGTGAGSMDGIWTGTLTLEGAAAGDSATAVLWEGELVVVSAGADAAYAGGLSRTADSGEDPVALEGDFRAYSAVGEAQGAGSVSATVAPEEELTATVTGTERDGDLDLGPADAFEESVSLEDLTGTWSQTRDGGTLSLSVNSLGSVTGSGADGCSYQGDLEALSDAPNLFRLALTVELCNADNGDYAGYAYLDAATSPDTLRLLTEREERDRFLGLAPTRD